jgi:serine/threonine protein kinase/Tfp pilus assembly protein PilF
MKSAAPSDAVAAAAKALALPVRSLAARADSALARAVDHAYRDYWERTAAGELIDLFAYCRQLPSPVGVELLTVLMCHEFLDAEKQLIEDTPPSEIAPAEEDARPQPWPEVGMVWEGFRLLEELGRGNFARVYLARELALGERLVAVKCTNLGRDEAAVLGPLDHPHVVPIHSIRTVPKTKFKLVCMPYLGHATLEQVCVPLPARPEAASCRILLEACRDSRLPEMTAPAILRRGSYLDGVRWITAQIASALTYLHEQGICHRDLKPSNILLQPDGSPRLLDFNLSMHSRVTERLVGGTLHYMAPEQLVAFEAKDDRSLTPQVDVYSLGVILYEWLSGAHPYAPLPDARDRDLLCQHLLARQQAGLPPLGPLVKIDRALAGLIERCLAYRPEDRPTASAIEHDLRRHLAWPRRWLRALAQAPVRTACVALLLGAGAATGVYLVAVQPPRAEVEYKQGWEAFRAGDFRQAVQHFDQALLQAAPAAEQFFARAQAYQRLGDVNSEYLGWAYKDYERAHQLAPRGEYSAGMAYTAHRSGDRHTAERLYQQALAQGFAPVAVHHNLGCIYLDQAKLKEASDHFGQALALDDTQPMTQVFLSQVLVRQEPPVDKVADGELPDHLRKAVEHLERGLARLEAVPKAQALFAAHVHTLAFSYNASHGDRALTWLERAVDAGADPAQIRQDPRFRSIRGQARFKALSERPAAASPPPAWVAILDPFTYESRIK